MQMNPLRRPALLLLLSCLWIAPAAAATRTVGKVAGVILDKRNDQPLVNANVYFANTTLGAATKNNGYFEINRIPPGTYDLVVSMMGYQTLQVPKVQVLAGRIVAYKIKLTPQIIELPGVKVEAERATALLPVERSNAGHAILTPRSIQYEPGSFDDAYRVISKLPSVATRNDINTQLYVRGGSPDQNLVLYDGIEIVMPSRLFIALGGGISLINPDLVESIDLTPAGFETDYGNKMSALMRINIREGRRDRLAVRTSASLLTARACAEGPLAGGRGSWLLAGRRSFYDFIANSFYDKNYIFPYYYDLHGKLTFDLNRDNRLVLFYSHLREGAQMKNLESEQLDLLNQGRGHVLGLRHSAILTPKLAANTILGYYADDNDLQLYDTFNHAFNARMKYQLRRVGLRADLHYYPRTWLRIKTGAEVTNHRDNVLAQVNWRTFVNVPDSVDFVSRSAKVGAYWQGRIKAQEWMELSAGLRYDYATLYNQAVWNPRAKLILSPSAKLSFWVSSGLFSQFPDVLTLIGRGEPLDITHEPASLEAENSIHNIVGVQWNPSLRSEVKVEVYRKTFANLLLSIDEESYVPDNIGEGSAEGIEISLERTRPGNERLGFWLYYTLASARYRRSGERDWTFFDYDQRQQINAGIDLRLTRRWILTLTNHYGTGFPYTPIRAMQRDISANNGFFTGWTMVRDKKNSGRYPDYWRFDARLSYETLIGRHRLAAYIEVINLFNHANIYLYEWDIHARSSGRGYAARSVIYMMPLVPSFGLHWSF
jgi:hypothetical protein